MAKEKMLANKNLLITVYNVIPLSHKSGLIGWVHNCDTLNKLIKEQRAISNTIPNIEHNYLNKLNPRYESSKLLNKVEIFLEIINNTKGEELKKIIWIKSKNCESWFIRTTNFSRSLAGMSILGYILGLGDRHLNNLLMSRKNGQIVHIDFGDCFEVAMKRDKFPEKVPFRLTRMLVKALGITEIEGMFRITCERMMNLLRRNKDSLIAILSALIHNPLISFRLMIPMIIKKQKYKKTINNFENENKSNSVIDEIMFRNDSTENHDFSLNVKKIIYKNNKNSTSSLGYRESKKDDELGENNGKIERQIIENEQRQLFNLYEENDEIDSEELHQIAQIVLNRINDKLNGMDFYQEHQLDEKEQVDKLIRQATLTENLAQSYLGWCPFW
jgi:FKBP12-rapamycin complex-associated protein